MAGNVRLLLILLLSGWLATSGVQAQTAATPEPDFLKTLPRPPDQPAALLAPAPPLGPPPPNLEQPYFQTDPLLDPPALGLPGWFGDVDMGILKPHLVNELSLPVNLPAVDSSSASSSPESVTVGVNASRLNWTVSPRFEIGYRLPSGFGGIAVGYRFLNAKGSEEVIGADGPATLSSRLDYNIGDLDWVSHEYTPWQLWEMRWRVGLRYFNAYFDSQANEPFAAAAAGSTIANQRTTNSVWTLGPHAAIDLRRRLNFWGLSLLGYLEVSEGWGRVRQNYFVTVTSGADGLPQTAQQSISTSDAVPIFMGRLGLNWQPESYSKLHLFAGYQLDYFWNTGRTGNFTTFGYFFDSGILLRGEWNF